MRGLRLGLSLAGSTARTGLVASRALIARYKSDPASNQQGMSRTAHFATDDISSFQIVLPGWYVDEATTNNEKSPGASVSYTAAVEYPSGTIKQITFSGNATGTCVAGANLISDAVSVSIPSGAQFWLRIWASCTGGFVYDQTTGSGVSGLTNCEFGLTVADKTMSGTIAGSNVISIPPLAIIGKTKKPCVAVIGDSRTVATGDTTTDATTGLAGFVYPGLKNVGYIGLAVPGVLAQQMAATSNTAMRRALATTYCDHILNYLGINDVSNSRTAAQIIADQQTIKANFGGFPMSVGTLDPHTTGTWTTDSGQATTTGESERTSYNTTVRGNPAWAHSIFDPANVSESTTNPGSWKANYTTDGLHHDATAVDAEVTAGIISSSLFA